MTDYELKTAKTEYLADDHRQHLENGDQRAVVGTSAGDIDAVFRKVDLRLIPPVFVFTMIAYLDRSNIGNARIEGMDTDLHMQGSDYNVALFVFFIPYILLDIPANLLMRKLRPSLWIGGLIFGFGVLTVCEGVTQTYGGLVASRFILGLFEAGYWPGTVYLISMYYPANKLPLRMAAFYIAGWASSAVGGLLAYGLAYMDGIGGYAAWRWIFIIEGLLTIVVAVLAIFLLPDWPEQVRFLDDRERQILCNVLIDDSKELVEDESIRVALLQVITDPKLWFTAIIYFGSTTVASSVNFFLPTILSQLGWTSVQAQYMSIPVWVAAMLFGMCICIGAERFRRRYVFIAPSLLFVVAAYAIQLNQTRVSVGVRYLACFLAVAGNFGPQPVVISWLSNNMVGKKKRGIALGLLLGIGNCGSVLGSNIFLNREAPRYRVGFGLCLAFECLAIMSATACFFYLRRENQLRQAGKRDYLLQLPADKIVSLGERHPAFRYVL